MKNKIVSWIKGQVKHSGAKGIVMGLSGGIDSAVVAALCKEAVGRNKLLVLFMPCNSNPQDLKDAKLVAARLGLKSKLVDLSSVYNNFLKVLPSAGGLAQGNLKPRLRMSALYYFANKLNYLVCGTGNKSELMVGYFTKYGDGGVDILPIADFGRAATNAISGTLYGARRSRHQVRISSRVAVAPSRSTTHAFGTWPLTGCSIAATPTSMTAGWDATASSTSRPNLPPTRRNARSPWRSSHACPPRAPSAF